MKRLKIMNSFSNFVYTMTGKDMDYHTRAQTTGLVFAEACWNKALECAAAVAEDVAPGRDAEAIAEAILLMLSNHRYKAFIEVAPEYKETLK